MSSTARRGDPFEDKPPTRAGMTTYVFAKRDINVGECRAHPAAQIAAFCRFYAKRCIMKRSF